MDVQDSKTEPVVLQGAQGPGTISVRLRHLDVDDLYLLSLLGEGKRLTDAARSLSLSQPAITQRIYKIENALSINILDRSSRITQLSEAGILVCKIAAETISVLEQIFSKISVEKNGQNQEF